MRQFTKDEKRIVKALLQSYVARENYGLTRNTSPDVSMRYHMAFCDAGWDIHFNKNVITFYDAPAYKIIRRYASRKVCGSYKSLMPTLEYIGG